MKLNLPPVFARNQVSSGEVRGFEAPHADKEKAPLAQDPPRVLPPPSAPGSAIEPLLELPPLAAKAPSKERFPEPQGVLQGWWQAVTDFVKGSSGTRESSRAKKIVDLVNEAAPRVRAMSDEELKGQTAIFKKLIEDATVSERKTLAAAEEKAKKSPDGQYRFAAKDVDKARTQLYKAEQKVLDKILPEVFATVREAGRRATGMEHYDVQVQAGALMHRGLIAEMYTGEGKTLAATLPVFLGALTGHGYHVATVNDYLARRDAEEMSQIYGYLGMSVGVLQGNLQQMVIEPGQKPKPCDRKGAYAADVTYGTASEFGFDYLRDNQVRDPEQRVQRPLYCVLLDEIDSLLIDEARIPLILAKKGPAPDTKKLGQFDQLARRIYDDVVAELQGKKKKDAIFGSKDIEWEEHWVSLTDEGIAKAEAALGFDPFADGKGEELAYLQDALKAYFNLSENGQYAVIDGKVSTVGLSGHPGPGRRFTGGLHQALEQKHGLEVLAENVTSASITMRDYLSSYSRASGMTGTAMSARDVFLDVYGLDVARVPTRKPLIRVDYPDKRFETQAEKTQRFLEDVVKVHETGRPILIGVEYTHTAEWLGPEIQKQLEKKGLKTKVEVLGARSDAEEARIIAGAGKKGAITVATTRGGRGVDIKLGGNAKLMSEPDAAKIAAKERAEVLAQGGLIVMAFEHLDSRRRDDQLRGRAGRQGEPGATIVYTSFEDPLYDKMRLDSSEKDKKLAYDAELMAKRTEEALDSSEGMVNGSLSMSVPFDRTLANYRQKFYDARREVLEASEVRGTVEQMISEAIDYAFEGVVPKVQQIKKEDAKRLYDRLKELLPLPEGDPPDNWTGSTNAEIRESIDKLVEALMKKRDSSVGPELARLVEKDAVLGAVDDLWGEYLESMLQLRDGIYLRAYGQKDPKVEYGTAAGELYGELMRNVAGEVTARVLKRAPKLPPAP
jgi:preprotein translocase subunit SecA